MSGMFHTVSRLRFGYHPGEVEAFFEHARRVYEGEVDDPLTGRDIRRAAFGMVRGGYSTAAVDAALDRLEHAFVARQRADFVAAHGQQAWMSHLAELAKTMYGRLTRPHGERFAPARRGEPAYDRREVDALCDRLVGFFDRGEPLTADEVRYSVFRPTKGSRGYAEGPVDAFLDRAVEVLLGVE